MFAHPPLKTCKIRTAGLASAKSAMFGMVRRNKDGSPRAHQGVDFASDEGYRVYAVLDGSVVDIRESASGYGNSILLAHIVDGKHYYTFYAHLSRIDVRKFEYNSNGEVVGPMFVKAGTRLGLTGDSGNAKGMTTIAKGGHLHFEVRDSKSVGLGLSGRLDPLPFLRQFMK